MKEPIRIGNSMRCKAGGTVVSLFACNHSEGKCNFLSQIEWRESNKLDRNGATRREFKRKVITSDFTVGSLHVLATVSLSYSTCIYMKSYIEQQDDQNIVRMYL